MSTEGGSGGGSGGGWGMNPDGLYSSGANIGDLGTDADTAGRQLLTAISDAEGVVHHHTVVAALTRYHGTVSKPAHQLGNDVRALGSQVQSGAVTGSQGDLDAASDATPALSGAEGSSGPFSRPANMPY